MAKAAQWGGAAGIRANMPEQIRTIKAAVDLPVIGLYKQWEPGTDVFITPNLEAAREVWEAGAEIIALDCTAQMIHGRCAYELLPEVKQAIPEAIDVSPDKSHGMHSLRHSLAVEMLRREVPLPVIQEVLGHKDPATTANYLRVDIEQLRSCALSPEVPHA